MGQYEVGEGANTVTHGFLLSHGVFTNIDVPGTIITVPYGINAEGTIVGEYTKTDDTIGGARFSAESWEFYDD